MSTLVFVKQFIKQYKQIGAILPSSSFLAQKMVKKEDIEKSNVIVELGAGTGTFTERIIKFSNNSKIFVIEKNKEFCKILSEKFSKHKNIIYNCDLMYLHKILQQNKIEKIDLIISGLPFKSLPLETFEYLIEKVIGKYFTETSKLIQFSYFKSFEKNLEPYFDKIEIERCWINLPNAYVFRCSDFKRLNQKFI